MSKSYTSMRLFGVPYQYNKTTDPRIDDVNPQIGNRFMQTVMSEPPILTIIPGKPKYLPGSNKDTKEIAGYLMLNASDTGDGSRFQEFLSQNKNSVTNKKNLRLYDFEKAYVEYMSYVNILCRTGAAFLGIDDEISIGGKNVALTKFDWSKYHLTSSDPGGVGQNLVKWVINKSNTDNKFRFDVSGDVGTEGKNDSLISNSHYVQFYVDPESSAGSDGMSNSTSESQLKSLFDSASGWAKELAFLMNSGGISSSKFGKFTSGSADALNSFIQNTLGGGTGTGAIARILNIGGNVLKGDNIIIPEIYQSSERESGHSVTIHLRTPYGTKLAYYLDIFVPLMHLMALAMPKETSANSYNSPFLIKAYMDGSWTSNLAICRSISVQRSPESRNMDGLPNELIVNLDIQDLYADLAMSKGASPKKGAQFINNASLVDFIATNCGMSLTQPNYEKKWKAIWNNIFTGFTDVPSTLGQNVNEAITNEAITFMRGLGLY